MGSMDELPGDREETEKGMPEMGRAKSEKWPEGETEYTLG